jgi:hypothetical protein
MIGVMEMGTDKDSIWLVTSLATLFCVEAGAVAVHQLRGESIEIGYLGIPIMSTSTVSGLCKCICCCHKWLWLSSLSAPLHGLSHPTHSLPHRHCDPLVLHEALSSMRCRCIRCPAASTRSLFRLLNIPCAVSRQLCYPVCLQFLYQ